jgi:hypothetical protein
MPRPSQDARFSVPVQELFAHSRWSMRRVVLQGRLRKTHQLAVPTSSKPHFVHYQGDLGVTSGPRSLSKTNSSSVLSSHSVNTPSSGFLVFFCNHLSNGVCSICTGCFATCSRMLNNPRSVSMGIVNFILSSQHVQSSNELQPQQ